MLEVLKLKAINVGVRLIERGGEASLLFVPSDRDISEVSEAMLIDGALPHQINTHVIGLAKKGLKNDKREFQAMLDKERATLTDVLELDGADTLTAKKVLTDARKERGKFKKSPILVPYQRTKPVKLS